MFSRGLDQNRSEYLNTCDMRNLKVRYANRFCHIYVVSLIWWEWVIYKVSTVEVKDEKGEVLVAWWSKRLPGGDQAGSGLCISDQWVLLGFSSNEAYEKYLE